ncbi:MAG: EAL domain-containing protein [Sulfurimonas sp.]|nr:EAL domain-containing protein [Sulfurimonas sp.]
MKINIYSITLKALLLLIISISMFIYYIFSETADERLTSLLMLSTIILSYYIYKSLKPLNDVEQSFNNLNEEISKKEAHLKDAQRIAKIGSWEYNLVTKTLSLSDEVYRTLGIKLSTNMEWEDFLNYIDDNDYNKVLAVLDDAIKYGSTFDLKYALKLKKNKKVYVQTSGKVRKKQDGSAKITAVSMDISSDIKNRQRIEELAYYDSLTGLANRLLLKDRIAKSIQHAKRDKENLALLFMDLDHFKLINDTLGHGVGDELLIYISRLLEKQVREADTISRFGGDEFIILLPNVKGINDAEIVAKKIQKALQQKHTIGSHQLYVTTSIGVSIYPEHADSIDDLITNADTAMYEAKKSGRNGYKIYSLSMAKCANRLLNLEQDLAEAIKNRNGIEIYYQAKIDATNNTISGAEALVRWNHQNRGLINPSDFIYIAESTGFMIELGYIIIEKTISHVNEFAKQGFKDLKVAINLSCRQFQDANLVTFISSMIKKHGVKPSQLEFEITESISMSNTDETLRILTELTSMGVSIAIDDFGTGYSSLLYLKKFPIKTIKIDRSFVMDMAADNSDRVITQTIVLMANSLNLSTVAEGVETQEQVDLLKDMGCNHLQGFLFSKPIPKNEFTKFLKNYIPNH